MATRHRRYSQRWDDITALQLTAAEARAAWAHALAGLTPADVVKEARQALADTLEWAEQTDEGFNLSHALAAFDNALEEAKTIDRLQRSIDIGKARKKP